MLDSKDEKKTKFVLKKAYILVEESEINKRTLEHSKCYKRKRMRLYIVIGRVEWTKII